MHFEGDLEQAWRNVEAALPIGWRLDGLRCASTGLAPEDRSALWRAVAVDAGDEELVGEGEDPLAALIDLAGRLAVAPDR